MQFLKRIDGWTLGALERFFFAKESALGIGLMRAAWGAVVLLSMGARVGNLTRYFSDSGIWPKAIEETMIRADRFTLLTWIREPFQVQLVFWLLMIAAFTTMIGLLPRISVIVTYVLLMSFHERNYMPLAGGDTVIRTIGFILVLAVLTPGLKAFSVHRLQEQWTHWKRDRTLLPGLTMPSWPRLLVTAQLTLIYVTSVIFKLYGSNWWSGSASAFPLHHDHFARFSPALFDAIPFFYPFLTWSTLLWEALWILFFIPPIAGKHLPLIRTGRFRRWMLLLGLYFHGGILITLAVGSFSWAMFAFYFGMLKAEDFAAMRKFFSRFTRKPVIMLYDGHCLFCVRTAFCFRIFDWLHGIRFENIRDVEVRNTHARGISLQELDRVVHVRMPDGTLRDSFDGIRVLLRRLPLAWPLVPVLWFPGMKHIGTPVYDFVAARRRRCDDESCRI